MSNTENTPAETAAMPEAKPIQIESLLDVKETAAILRISPQTLERLLSQQKMGSYKIAGRVLISEERHIKPFLAQCERPAQN